MAIDLDSFIKEMEAELLIDENALEEAFQAQAELLYRVSKQYAFAVSRRDATKQDLEEARAKADIVIRRKARADEEKITEKEIEAQVRINVKVIDAIEEHLHESHYVGMLGALKGSFIARGYALQELRELYTTNYYGDPSIGRSEAAERRNKAARQAMNEARRNKR